MASISTDCDGIEGLNEVMGVNEKIRECDEKKVEGINFKTQLIYFISLNLYVFLIS